MRKIILWVLVIGAGWWLLGKLKLVPSFGDLLAPEPVVIDETATLIRQIQPLAQLVTVSAYDEIVVDSAVHVAEGVKVLQPLLKFVLPPGLYVNKAVVIIGKTVTHVGVDLKKVRQQDIRIAGDSVFIALPPAEVLDVVLNPSDVEIFIEKGTWDNAAIAALKNDISRLAADHVLQKGLLEEAHLRAVELLTRLLRSSGKKVQIRFRPALG